MSSPFEDPELPQLTSSRAAPPPSQGQYNTMLGQTTFGSTPVTSQGFQMGSYNNMPMSGTLPVNTMPPPTAPRGSTAGRSLSPPMTQDPYSQQFAQSQDLYSSSPGLQPSNMPQTGVRSLPASRIMQSTQGLESQSTIGTSNAPHNRPNNDQSRRLEAASAPPAVFTSTALIPQIRAQESTATLTGGSPLAEEENEFLQQRVEELEQQLYASRSRQPEAANPGELASLQRRLAQAQDSEASALRQQEARLHEINELQRQLQTVSRAPHGGDERSLELQRQLEAAKSSEDAHARRVQEQALQLQEQAQLLSRSGIPGSAAVAPNTDAQRLIREKEAAEKKAAEIARAKTQAEMKTAEIAQEHDRKVGEFKTLEDNYQKQLQEERRKVNTLQQELESASKTKDFHVDKADTNLADVQSLQTEVTYLKSVETYHKNQNDAHRKEVLRLKRLREEDAPPPADKRMPLKALEERIMHLACFTMMGICALPIMGAIACLNDESYVFWLGKTWPWIIIGACFTVFLIFVGTLEGLFQYAIPEHRSQFTMAFTMATFAALLGVVLVPLSLMANKEAVNIASTISQGCLTSMPQSELLVDYSQVLYNIRVSQNCTGADSVKECEGYSSNKYTAYLEYLEQEFRCGPLCPESPPPARVVRAPTLHNAVPEMKPVIPAPRFPAVQNALGDQAAFLQAASGALVGHQVQLHKHEAAVVRHLPSSNGVMETALPHMQAEKLFSQGKTRMTCYPLISTRLQVLVSTFGGLWYWEGMGLIMVSLLTSLYAGIFFAYGMA